VFLERSGNVCDGADLRDTDARDDTRRTDRARADADLDGVGAGVDECERRLIGHDVAGDDLLRRPARLDLATISITANDRAVST
jgi:hypothetical protein